MSSTMPILSAIDFIASTVARTASPPSLASLADLLAMPSVTRAFSVFCPIEADICSIEAVVSSRLAACSDEPCASDCEVALTSSEAADSESAAARTLPTVCDRLPTMHCIAYSRLDWSPLRSCTSTVRSPPATRCATSAAYAGSPPSWRTRLRPSSTATTSPSSTAAPPSAEISTTASATRSLVTLPPLLIKASPTDTTSLTRLRYTTATALYSPIRNSRASSRRPSSTSFIRWSCIGMYCSRLSTTALNSSLPRGVASFGPSSAQVSPSSLRPPRMRSLAFWMRSGVSAITRSRPPMATSFTPTSPFCSICTLGQVSLTISSTSALINIRRWMLMPATSTSNTSTTPNPSPSLTLIFMFLNTAFSACDFGLPAGCALPYAPREFFPPATRPAHAYVARCRSAGLRARSHAGPVAAHRGSAPLRRSPGSSTRQSPPPSRTAGRAA